MKEIWLLQPRFEMRAGQKPFRLLEQPRFRAAYDFLLLRAECGLVEKELADWWTQFQACDEGTREVLISDAIAAGKGGEVEKSKRRKRSRHRKPVSAKSAAAKSE
jgi:poly(A) polymerase